MQRQAKHNERMVQFKWFENEFKKTQCIVFATPNFNKRTETFQITIDDTVRHMEDKVKIFDNLF